MPDDEVADQTTAPAQRAAGAERVVDDVAADRDVAQLTTTDVITITKDPDDIIAEVDEELPARVLPVVLDRIVGFYCAAISCFVLYQVFFPLRQGTQFSLIVFLSLTLPLAFVLYRGRLRRRGGSGSRPQWPTWWDWTLTAAALVAATYPILPFVIGDGGGGFNDFLDRQGSLGTVDVIAGTALTLLILEAARRTTGFVLPIFCIVFFLYAYYGGYIPMEWPLSHIGLNFDQIINGFFNDQSGFFGTPLNVAATYIVLFIIYGAVLSATGAGRFFIDFSFSLFRTSPSAPGRTVVTSGFLLGTVSGSGTATAVTLGSLAWPILKRAGYPANNAGGMLAAAGIGAILSPPTLGAAAFIIAEYLQVSYFDVMVWAVIPTILYYAGIFLAVEIDARRFGTRAVDIPRKNVWWLLRRFGYHFLSLAIIIVFLGIGLPPFRSIAYATGVAALFGLIERMVSRRDPLDETAQRVGFVRAMGDYVTDLYRALGLGIRNSIPVVAVCAAAGIITSVIVKTGLGLTFAQMLVSVGGAFSDNPQVILAVTVVLAAFAIILLGLAVPVTASFIISWVVIGPALLSLGVAAPEAAMFIFYFSVLSEVSPPTALAAVAAAAITGGDTIKTMWQATKYTLPAFLVPIAFVLTPAGEGLLLRDQWVTTIWVGLVSLIAVAALAGATGGWIRTRANAAERLLLAGGALFCLYLEAPSIAVGLTLIALAVVLHTLRLRRSDASDATRPAAIAS